MGFSSQAGHLVLGTQTQKGTPLATLDEDGVAMKLRSGALAPNRELLIPDPEIGGGRDVADAYLGAVSWSGDFEFYARMKALPTLLRGALGSVNTGTTTGVSTHTITPSDAALLPFLSAQHAVGSGLEVYDYSDIVVNTLHLEAEANGYLQGTAGLIAINETAGATPIDTDALDDATPMMVGTNITLTYNGVSLPAKSFALDINNNFEDDDFRLGSLFLNQLSPKRREVTGSFTIRPENSALWRQAVYGGSALTQAGGQTVKQQLVITCQTYEYIPGATPSTTTYGLTITIPKVALQPYALEPSGDDLIENDIEWQALRPAIATPILTAVVRNGTAEVA